MSVRSVAEHGGCARVGGGKMAWKVWEMVENHDAGDARSYLGALLSRQMRPSFVPVPFVLAALAMLGGCTCAAPESMPAPAAGVSTASPVASDAPAAALAPTAVAKEEPDCSPWCNQPGKDESGCPAVADHPGLEGTLIGSWKKILSRVQEVERNRSGGTSPWDSVKPSASDAEIRRALTGKPDGAASAWVIAAGLPTDTPNAWHVVAKRSDGKLALFLDVATPSEHNVVCFMTTESAIETNGMPRLIIDEVLFTPGPEGFRYGCEVESYVRRTIFLDVSKLDVPLAIEQKVSAENNAKPVWVEIVPQKDGVKIKGAGCDLEEPLRL
jgi:hypothetical protein